MGSICPRSFLFVIIQGINLVYSPQEPVAVALALPAKSLDTQSVGTKQQLGLSHSCQLNRGAGWILAGFAAYIWRICPSVTSESSSSFCSSVSSFLFDEYTYLLQMLKSHYTDRSWRQKCCFLGLLISIRHTWEIRGAQCLIHYISKNKQMMNCSKMFQTYL